MYRLNGQYVVFDPNYPEGMKQFNNEEDLIEELRTNVFSFEGSDMALTVSQITSSEFKPDSSLSRAKPADYVREYLDVDSVAFYPPGKSVANDVYIAAGAEDKEIIKIYFELDHERDWTANELKEVGIQAILKNNANSLDAILDKLNACPAQTKTERKDKEGAINVLILLALRDGRNELFQKIITDDYGKKIFDTIDDSVLLNMVARGGNPELLNNILERVRNNAVAEEQLVDTEEVDHNEESKDLDELADVIQMNLSDFLGDDFLGEEEEIAPESQMTEMAVMLLEFDSRGENAIICAIKGNSPECLGILLKQLTKENYVPTTEEYQSYLSAAINKNDVRMVDKLINHIDPNMLSSVMSGLTLSSEQMKKTNLHILQTLEKNGFPLEKQGQLIVAEKEAQKTGIIEIIGIKLVKFIDYMQAALGLKSVSQKETNPSAETQTSSSPDEEKINSLNTSPKEKFKAIFNDFKQKSQALKPLDKEDELVLEGPRPCK
ncbi:hypothetical protein J2N86_08260 [Legionella lytica]|uniref:Ankyrin repeats (3 copies) n=1 Tax=Legionella lytica TaxID=96232 RepID=A0ABY4Y6G1_9GAMM|nr:hypothetical protein [Legionella lytica]USQ12704.1 hypothetical protein J2N86_08260 [Legionella lytica]